MIGIPGTALKEVSPGSHDKPGVQKVACKQGSELLRTCLEAVSHECQVQSWTLQGAVKEAVINHSDPPQLTLLPSAPGTAISQPVQGFPVSHLDSSPIINSQPRLPLLPGLRIYHAQELSAGDKMPHSFSF